MKERATKAGDERVGKGERNEGRRKGRGRRETGE